MTPTRPPGRVHETFESEDSSEPDLAEDGQRRRRGGFLAGGGRGQDRLPERCKQLRAPVGRPAAVVQGAEGRGAGKEIERKKAQPISVACTTTVLIQEEDDCDLARSARRPFALRVRNLPRELHEEGVRNIFSKFGNVLDVVIMSKGTG